MCLESRRKLSSSKCPTYMLARAMPPAGLMSAWYRVCCFVVETVFGREYRVYG